MAASDRAGQQAGDAEVGPLLAALVYRSPVGVSIYDTELRLRWMNDTSARQTERSERHLGHRLAEHPAGFDAPSLEAILRRVLDENARVPSGTEGTRAGPAG
ncbi:PAS domain-containing protein [Streptomyces sp. B6B3]|uniref:PAS domain-containing protein n=1 Tax=Streptomyces sp. B6B3 TaxID=3153570 RepID=UPI00325DA227